MYDLILLFLLLVAVAVAAAAMSDSPVEWAREEWRRIRADTWAPSEPAENTAGSVADPRVARMDLRMRALGKRMRREGRTLHSPQKRYVPVLTKPAPAERPPKADRVVTPLRFLKR